VGPISPQKKGHGIAVTHQLLSSRYSFTQDSTINIPWWRKKEGQWVVGVRERKRGMDGWGRSTTPLAIFVLLDSVGPFWLGNVNQRGKAPTGPRALLNPLNGGPPKRHPPQSDLSSSLTHHAPILLPFPLPFRPPRLPLSIAWAHLPQLSHTACLLHRAK
jgi:hypothetical protein